MRSQIFTKVILGQVNIEVTKGLFLENRDFLQAFALISKSMIGRRNSEKKTLGSSLRDPVTFFSLRFDLRSIVLVPEIIKEKILFFTEMVLLNPRPAGGGVC